MSSLGQNCQPCHFNVSVANNISVHAPRFDKQKRKICQQSECSPQLITPMRRYATFVARGSIRYVGYIRLKDSSVPKQRIWICSRALSQYGPISSTTPTAATHSPSTTVSPALLSQSTSTIYALSSAPGRAGIAIIRISGTACLDVKILLP